MASSGPAIIAVSKRAGATGKMAKSPLSATRAARNSSMLRMRAARLPPGLPPGVKVGARGSLVGSGSIDAPTAEIHSGSVRRTVGQRLSRQRREARTDLAGPVLRPTANELARMAWSMVAKDELYAGLVALVAEANHARHLALTMNSRAISVSGLRLRKSSGAALESSWGGKPITRLFRDLQQSAARSRPE